MDHSPFRREERRWGLWEPGELPWAVGTQSLASQELGSGSLKTDCPETPRTASCGPVTSCFTGLRKKAKSLSCAALGPCACISDVPFLLAKSVRVKVTLSFAHP